MVLTPVRLEKIPHRPGVYTFTRRGVPLYVGKAADLRARLRAYLPDGDWKTDMVREATGLRVERTGSELEALLLEAARIAQQKPRYNVEQRSERSFLSILVTTDEEFPQVLPTRSHRRAGTYVGPFTSARAVRETLKALRKVFPYRCNRQPIVAEPTANSRQPEGRAGLRRRDPNLPAVGFPLSARTAKPCLYFHLGLCAGTCAGRITKADYRRRVITPLIRVLRGETRAARRMLDVEHRVLLDRLLAETQVLSRVERFELGGRDLQRVLGLPRVPHRIEGYDISNLHGREAVGSMVVAIDGEPDPSEYKRFLIREGQGMANDPGMIHEVLTRRLRHLPAVSLRGARPRATKQSRTPLAGIASSLGFGGLDDSTSPHPPRPLKRQAVVVSRRLGSRNDNGVWPTPDLILVDGGKAQRNAAMKVLRAAGVDVPLVALAKQEEEVFLPNSPYPLRLSRYSPALQLLQRVRDEAHRFAIAYHRERYRKRILSSH